MDYTSEQLIRRFYYFFGRMTDGLYDDDSIFRLPGVEAAEGDCDLCGEIMSDVDGSGHCECCQIAMLNAKRTVAFVISYMHDRELKYLEIACPACLKVHTIATPCARTAQIVLDS